MTTHLESVQQQPSCPPDAAAIANTLEQEEERAFLEEIARTAREVSGREIDRLFGPTE